MLFVPLYDYLKLKWGFMFMKFKILFLWLLGNVWKTNLKQRLNQQLLKHIHEIMVPMSHEKEMLYESTKVWLLANIGTYWCCS